MKNSGFFEYENVKCYLYRGDKNNNRDQKHYIKFIFRYQILHWNSFYFYIPIRIFPFTYKISNGTFPLTNNTENPLDFQKFSIIQFIHKFYAYF